MNKFFKYPHVNLLSLILLSTLILISIGIVFKIDLSPFKIELFGSETEGKIISATNTTNSKTITCNSCKDCTSKINAAKSGTTVKLAKDIAGDNVYPDPWGAKYYKCINWESKASSVTFDCGGRKIKGTRTSGNGIPVAYGISMIANNNTVKNCEIINYYTGINVKGKNNLITNNKFTYTDFNKNWAYYVFGVIFSGTNNRVSNNEFNSIPYGVMLQGVSYPDENNIIENNNIYKVTHGILLVFYDENRNTIVRSNKLSRCYYGIELQDFC